MTMNLLQCVQLPKESTRNQLHPVTTNNEDTVEEVIDANFFEKKNYQLIIKCLDGGKSLFCFF